MEDKNKKDEARYICRKCKRIFSRKSNLQEHYQTHLDKNLRDTVCCCYCGKHFYRKRNLTRHLSICNKNNQNNNSKAQVHRKVKCAMCPYEDSEENVLRHYNEQHDIEIVTECTTFNSFDDFEKWKDETEKTNIAKYRRYDSHKSSIKTHYYYRCNRDGFYKSDGKNIRHLKIMGSIKINGFCPSKLTVAVENENGHVSVKFVKTHVGHQMDLGKIPLGKTERNMLASKLSLKIPSDETLNSVRENVNENRDENNTVAIRRCDSICQFRMEDKNKKDEAGYICRKCKRIFSRESNLQEHYQTHLDKNLRDTVCCCYCGKHFYRKRNLTKHLSICNKNNQNNNSKAQVYRKVKCAMCPCEDSEENVSKHYNQQHDIEIVTECITFNSFDDFEKWKDETEKTNIAKYIRYDSQKSSIKTHYYYRCNRDGFYKSDGKNIRHLKIMGSIKINGFCPSKLTVAVENENGHVSVKFVKTHVGHQMDLGKIPLGKTERNMLASKLNLKIPFDEILNSVRDNVDENRVERIHLLTRKDLFNIEQSHKINNSMRHSNDCIKGRVSTKLSALRKRHQNMEQIKDKPIIEEQDGNWILSSATKRELCKIQMANPSCKCEVKCMKCDTCIHGYICSCPDSSVKWNMCKHIHLLCQSGLTNTRPNVLISEDNYLYIHCDNTVAEKEIALQQLTSTVSSKKTNIRNIDQYKDKISGIYQSVLTQATTMEQCNVIHNAVAPLATTLAAMESPQLECFPSCSEEHTRTIKQQRKFVSTKKCRTKRTNIFKQPSMDEKNKLAFNLLHFADNST